MIMTRKLFFTPVFAALFMLTGCNGEEPEPIHNQNDGKAVTKLAIVYTDNESTETNTFTFDYDEQNRISSFTFRQEVETTTYIDYLCRYTYASGNITADIFTRINDNPDIEGNNQLDTQLQVIRMTATLDENGRASRSTYTEAFENGQPIEGIEPGESQYTYDELGQLIRDEVIENGQPTGTAMTMNWQNGDLLGFNYTTHDDETTFLYTEHANKGLTDVNQILSWFDSMEHVTWRLAGVLGVRSNHCALPTYWWRNDSIEVQATDYKTETDSDGYITSIHATNAAGKKLTVTLTY